MTDTADTTNIDHVTNEPMIVLPPNEAPNETWIQYVDADGATQRVTMDAYRKTGL
jgi:hypothetical protein